ncbi:MAG: hypothetical protein ACREC0_09085 [Methylocella sp.]
MGRTLNRVNQPRGLSPEEAGRIFAALAGPFYTARQFAADSGARHIFAEHGTEAAGILLWNPALEFNRDERDCTPALEILRRIGLGTMRPLTNNPQKARYVGQAQGLKLQEVVSLIGEVTARDGRHPLEGW